MSEPSSIDFRIAEEQSIIDDIATIAARVAKHQTYLSDPVLAPTHKIDVRDTDVVLANLSLTTARLNDATGQMKIALRMTKLGAEAKAAAAAKAVADAEKAHLAAEAAAATETPEDPAP